MRLLFNVLSSSVLCSDVCLHDAYQYTQISVIIHDNEDALDTVCLSVVCVCWGGGGWFGGWVSINKTSPNGVNVFGPYFLG